MSESGRFVQSLIRGWLDVEKNPGGGDGGPAAEKRISLVQLKMRLGDLMEKDPEFRAEWKADGGLKQWLQSPRQDGLFAVRSDNWCVELAEPGERQRLREQHLEKAGLMGGDEAGAPRRVRGVREGQGCARRAAE